MEFKDYSLPETRLEDVVAHVETHATPMEVDIDEQALREAVTATPAENATVTRNSGVAYKSTLSACLDLFYEVQEESSAKTINTLLEAAWKEDANATLRLIFQLRDIRSGKGIRNAFLFCLVWLRHEHFSTLLHNLEHVADVGCWKDLMELLVVEMLGVEEYLSRESVNKGRAYAVGVLQKAKRSKESMSDAKRGKLKKAMYNPAAKVDKDKAMADARKAFLENPEYQQLHVRIASLFASALKKDLTAMKNGKGISLACKWAPTGGKRHDIMTLSVSTIAQLLFPQKEIRKEGCSYSAYVSIARDLYRKVYLSPLRKYSKVIERYMSENRWAEIPYDRVPSVCMKRQKTTFINRDSERFKKFLEDVKDKKKTIKAAALKPHGLVEQVQSFHGSRKNLDETELKTIQLQWEAYVDSLRKSGTLSNCMAVCDVSGSMYGTPVIVAVALSLLVADLAEAPFKGLVCTFSSYPELFCVPDGPLDVKVGAVYGMNWDRDTDVEKVFDLLLERAVEANIPKKAMIKRLFIFSDMQFSQASRSGKTSYEAAKEKFNEAGYDLPQVVFWNLAGGGYGCNTAPVVKHENDTALVSGYSGQLLKLFMEGDINSFDPVSILMKAIESYDYLTVVD